MNILGVSGSLRDGVLGELVDQIPEEYVLQLAEELKGTGVRVNSILPSIIDTAANRKAMPGADSGKWPKPQDIARVILFLCSDDAKVIHGSALPVYGDT